MVLVMKTISLVVLMLWLLTCTCPAYELQDTIHNLKEENLQLQHRLGNLTHALQDLKQFLSDYSKVSDGGHYSEYQRAWKEWSQHGISPETHKMLEQALCFPELHGSAVSLFNYLALSSLLSITSIALN